MARRTGEVETKSENKQSVFRYILNHGSATRQELYTGLGLSLPTIKQALEFLEVSRLIAVSGTVRNTGGRNASAYSVLNGGFHAIGVYLAQRHISAVCVDLSGAVVCAKRLSLPLEPQKEAYLESIGTLVAEVKHTAGVSDSSLLGVGLAVPSLVSDDGESVIYGMTSDFTGVTRTVLSRHIPYPTGLYHDSDAAGFAEVWKSTQLRNTVYLNLNSSVGGCVIVNGQLYRGEHHLAGELGHMIVQPSDGKRCYCGQTGCFDTVCNTGVLDSYTGGNLDAFFQCLKAGDKTAAAIWDVYLDHLALAIHNLRMVLDCSFIIGGDAGAYMGDYLHELCRKVDAMNIFTQFSGEYIFPCHYRHEATAAGAAIQIIENRIQSL